MILFDILIFDDGKSQLGSYQVAENHLKYTVQQ